MVVNNISYGLCKLSLIICKDVNVKISILFFRELWTWRQRKRVKSMQTFSGWLKISLMSSITFICQQPTPWTAFMSSLWVVFNGKFGLQFSVKNSIVSRFSNSTHLFKIWEAAKRDITIENWHSFLVRRD